MKKKFCIVFLSGMLSACINFSFDNIEYDRMVSIHRLAEAGKNTECKNSKIIGAYVGKVTTLIDHQWVYANHRANRTDIKDAVNQLKVISDQFKSKNGSFSIGYCEEKFSLISDSSLKIIEVLGVL